MQISGSIALVTGANRGLGRHFVEGLIGRGASKVYACARRPGELTALEESHGALIAPLQLDVTDPQAVGAAAQQAGDVTLLVSNAGVLESRGLLEADSLEPLEREMAVNVYGLARMCLAFAPVIAANGGGAIVNMLSVASLHSFPPFGSYCASKAAAMSLTHCLRYELKDRGIETFGVYAGYIDTGMIDYVNEPKADPRDVVKQALQGVENGTPDIDADDFSRAMRATLREDPDAVERAAWQEADEFRSAYPVGRE